MSMGEVNTRIFWKLFWFWLGIIIIIVASTGCSEYNSDMRVTWSTSIQNLDDSNDPWEDREIIEPTCREEEIYYIDQAKYLYRIAMELELDFFNAYSDF